MNLMWKRMSELVVTKYLKLPNGRVINNNRLVTVTNAAIILNSDDHGERPIVLSRAAGIAVTLPASTGSGAKYEFFVRNTITSNTTTIKVANVTDVMNGNAIQSQDGGATVQMWEAAAADDTITFNGTTTGGISGDYVELTDISAGFWAVKVISAATGVEATPFSATV